MPAYSCQIISSFTFIIGTLSFLCSFLIHIVIWRTLRPGKQILLLATIFVLAPLCVFSILFALAHIYQTPGSCFAGNILKLSGVFIWHLALSGGYIMSYPAVQAQSPSLMIILAVAASEPHGMTAQEIENIFPPDALIKDRYDDLHTDGLLTNEGGKTVQSLSGRMLAKLFTGYRRLLDLPMGDG